MFAAADGGGKTLTKKSAGCTQEWDRCKYGACDWVYTDKKYGLYAKNR